MNTARLIPALLLPLPLILRRDEKLPGRSAACLFTSSAPLHNTYHNGNTCIKQEVTENSHSSCTQACLYCLLFHIFFSPNIPDADSIFAVKSLQLFGKEASHMQICDEARKKLDSKDLNRRYLETGSEFWVRTGSLCPKYDQKYRSRIMILVTIDSLNVNVNGFAVVSFPLVLAWPLGLFF